MNELYGRRGASKSLPGRGDDDLRYDFAAELEQAENAESPNRARTEFIRVQLRLSQLPQVILA